MNTNFTRRNGLKLLRKSDGVRSIEISISAATISGEALHDLKEMLAKDSVMSKYHITVKPSAPVPYAMGDTGVVLYASCVAAIEVLAHHSLEFVGKVVAEALKDVSINIRKKHPEIKKLEMLGSIHSEEKTTSFALDDSEIKYYSERSYTIDPKKTFVLLIGCADYVDPTIPSIPPVLNNINELVVLFADPAYFGIPKNNIFDFTNLSTAEIRTHILKISRRNDLETFIFYYAGHGLCTNFDSYSLAGTDSLLIDGTLNTGVDKPFLVEAVNRSKAKHNIFFVDACFSGMLTQGRGPSNLASDAIRGGYILTSSHAKQPSFYESAQSLTYFTGALIDTVRRNTGNQSASITLGNLYRGVSKSLEAKGVQAPTYRNGLNIDHSNFIIAKNPAFSIKNAIRTIEAMKGDVLRALEECEALQAQFPANKDLKKLREDLEKTYRVRKIVSEGDNHLVRQQYAKASELYAMALEQHEDMNVRERMQLCETSSRAQSRKKIKHVIIALVSIFIAVLAAKLLVSGRPQSGYIPNDADAVKNESPRGPTSS
ncbi:hypothetical protein FLLO111716_01990 [Flavobacterium longum]|uniref:caspase family protein n=1 Tax=Flavobacterium longum TaxID=1299340 RepID=UPI0039ED35C5